MCIATCQGRGNRHCNAHAAMCCNMQFIVQCPCQHAPQIVAPWWFDAAASVGLWMAMSCTATVTKMSKALAMREWGARIGLWESVERERVEEERRTKRGVGCVCFASPVHDQQRATHTVVKALQQQCTAANDQKSALKLELCATRSLTRPEEDHAATRQMALGLLAQCVDVRNDPQLVALRQQRLFPHHQTILGWQARQNQLCARENTKEFRRPRTNTSPEALICPFKSKDTFLPPLGFSCWLPFSKHDQLKDCTCMGVGASLSHSLHVKK